MKIKRTAAGILAAAMLLPCFGANAASEKDCAAAMERIGEYSLLVGRGDGYELEANVTRAELAVILCRLARSAPAEYNGEFADVPAEHWGAGYIKAAADMGYMSADENGDFSPEANVTFAQLARVMVSLIGFDDFALARGGYPMGYMTAAKNMLKIYQSSSTKAEEEATRGDVAVVLSRMLDVRLVIVRESSNGVEAAWSDEYTVKDFLNGTVDTLIITES